MNYALGYYANNGKIMETAVFKNKEEFEKEIKASNEIGRPIKMIKVKDVPAIEHTIYKSEKETMASCFVRLQKLKKWEMEEELER